MVYRPVAEEVAGGKTRVAGSDDDRGDALDGYASGDFDGDVSRVGQRVEDGRALLRLGDERLDLLR